MKSFLITVAGIAAVLLGLWLCVFYFGIYIDFAPDAPIEVPFRACDHKLERRLDDGGYEELTLRAVDVSASLPGHASSECEPSEEDYLRWFENIGKMGANAVQTDSLMDADFYNALYSYNASAKSPLYLFQGLSVPDLANYGENDAYDKDFYDKLIHDGEVAVDIIHGRRNVSVATSGAVGYYRRDISQWTLGYLVGYEWSADTVAYTDHSVTRAESYEGEHISAGENASRFEVMLARVMDRIVSYETDKYKQQRLVSFANDPSNDPFEYADEYVWQLSKFNRIDAEHIVQKDYSGLFASYRIYDFCKDPISLFSQEQLRACSGAISRVDRSGVYGGYIQLLSYYHKLPVYIMGYGFSTARAPISDELPPCTEKEQGEHLTEVWRETVNADCSGACISSWQDSWERRTWNTSFAVTLTRTPYWHDLQSDSQGYGVMEFLPGEEESVCLLDGKSKEWSDSDKVLEAEEKSLSLRYDSECVYIMLAGERVSEKPLYIPIDLNPQTGSLKCADPKLSFDSAADFVLCVDGEKNSRLLVQDRYDAAMENFSVDIGESNVFYHPPALDSDKFTVSWLPVKRSVLFTREELQGMSQEDISYARHYGVWETGKLRAGCGDPESKNYDSLADICFGDGCVEIRIPWLLLNISDPSLMTGHEDYYDNYGVKSRSLGECKIGLGTGGETIEMNNFSLKGWNVNIPYRERLKQSYYIVRRAWSAVS